MFILLQRPEKDVSYSEQITHLLSIFHPPTQFLPLLDMLREDGGLNDLGKLYIGANTVHTSNRSDSVGPQYQTVSPSDRPGQPLVTAWPKENTAQALTSWTWVQGGILAASLLFGVFVAFV